MFCRPSLFWLLYLGWSCVCSIFSSCRYSFIYIRSFSVFLWPLPLGLLSYWWLHFQITYFLFFSCYPFFLLHMLESVSRSLFVVVIYLCFHIVSLRHPLILFFFATCLDSSVYRFLSVVVSLLFECRYLFNYFAFYLQFSFPWCNHVECFSAVWQ